MSNLGGIGMVGESDLKEVCGGGMVSWGFELRSDSSRVRLTFDTNTGSDDDNAPEWSIALNDSNDELWSNYRSKNDVEIDLVAGKPKALRLEVICPSGARYGDKISITAIADTGSGRATMTFDAVAKQSILILKTQMDQEKAVAEALIAKVQATPKEKDIFAIFSPPGLRGYIFVECMNSDRVRQKPRDIRKAHSFIEGETGMNEIDHYLTPVSTVKGIVDGDLVELISGPFKGEIARVQQIDHSREEITVELVEAMVPIPVTVRGDSVRIIEKEK